MQVRKPITKRPLLLHHTVGTTVGDPIEETNPTDVFDALEQRYTLAQHNTLILSLPKNRDEYFSLLQSNQIVDLVRIHRLRLEWAYNDDKKTLSQKTSETSCVNTCLGDLLEHCPKQFKHLARKLLDEWRLLHTDYEKYFDGENFESFKKKMLALDQETLESVNKLLSPGTGSISKYTHQEFLKDVCTYIRTLNRQDLIDDLFLDASVSHGPDFIITANLPKFDSNFTDNELRSRVVLIALFELYIKDRLATPGQHTSYMGALGSMLWIKNVPTSSQKVDAAIAVQNFLKSDASLTYFFQELNDPTSPLNKHKAALEDGHLKDFVDQIRAAANKIPQLIEDTLTVNVTADADSDSGSPRLERK